MRTTNKTLDSSEQYQAIQCLWLQVTPTVIFYLNIATLFREHMQENCMFSLTGKEVLTEFYLQTCKRWSLHPEDHSEDINVLLQV